MIRVVIIEDDHDIRQGLAIIIGAIGGFSCAGAFESAEEALASIHELLPDVCLVDINLPGMSGIDFISVLKPRFPDTQFIIFTVFEDVENIFKALKAGATGYLLKSTSPLKIIEAISEVCNGASPMSGPIARKVLAAFTAGRDVKGQGWELLSKREQEILTYLSKGYRYKEIAEKTFISIDTVRSHIRNIYEKLQVESRTAAVNKIFLKG